MEIEIRPLRPDDERSSFASGDVELDRFFRKYAGQNQFRLHVGVTYVASTAGLVVGYVTIAPGSMVIDRLPRRERQRLPAYPLPILRLARLAVSTTHQGQGIGSRLVRFALEMAREMARRFGCVGVVVDALPEALRFYARLGFFELVVEAGALPSRPASCRPRSADVRRRTSTSMSPQRPLPALASPSRGTRRADRRFRPRRPVVRPSTPCEFSRPPP